MSAAQDAPLCVFCRRHVAVREWRPFCSQRCQIQDLARWADASYRVAGPPAPGPPAAGDPVDDPACDRVEDEPN